MLFLTLIPLRLARVLKLAFLPVRGLVWFMEATIITAAFLILVGVAGLCLGWIPSSVLTPLMGQVGQQALVILHNVGTAGQSAPVPASH